MTNSLRLSGMLLTAVLLAPLTARAQQVEDDYLSYDIPPNAEKVGPGINKGGSIYYHFFFPAGVHTRESLVSIETYFEKQLVERQFMKKGLIHGLQKTWHNDGTLRSESPYKEGVMHGTFREWNEKGQLIVQYHLVNGTGRKRLYNDEGRLMIDEPMEQSQKHGLCMERTRNLGILSLYRLKNGVLTGKAFDFYPSSQLSAVVCKTEKGA